MNVAKTLLAALFLLVVSISPAKASTVTGDLAVYKNGTLIGYVSDVYDGQNSFTYTANIASALEVQVNTSSSAPFSVLSVNHPGTNLYFGAVGGSGGYNFSSSSDGYAYLTDTGLTAAGATPTSTSTDLQSLGYNAPAESTIWSFNGNTLGAQWVDANGTVVDPVTVFYDPTVNYLGITDDLSGYNSAYGDGAYAVTLDFTGDLGSPAPTPEPESLSLLATGCAALYLKLRRRR